jgi:predicted ATPase
VDKKTYLLELFTKSGEAKVKVGDNSICKNNNSPNSPQLPWVSL